MKCFLLSWAVWCIIFLFFYLIPFSSLSPSFSLNQYLSTFLSSVFYLLLFFNCFSLFSFFYPYLFCPFFFSLFLIAYIFSFSPSILILLTYSLIFSLFLLINLFFFLFYFLSSFIFLFSLALSLHLLLFSLWILIPILSLPLLSYSPPFPFLTLLSFLSLFLALMISKILSYNCINANEHLTSLLLFCFIIQNCLLLFPFVCMCMSVCFYWKYLNIWTNSDLREMCKIHCNMAVHR